MKWDDEGLTLNQRSDLWLRDLDEFTVPDQAQKFVTAMEEKFPDQLGEWQYRRTLADVGGWMSAQLRDMRRSSQRRKTPFELFAETGDVDHLSPFRATYVVSDDLVRRRVGDMTGPDHSYVAGGYTASANQDALLASFHVAVAKKVKNRRTAEVMTTTQYEDLLAAITGNPK